MNSAEATYTADQIIAIGGSHWANGKSRVYLNDWPEFVGLAVTRDGDVRSAALDGERLPSRRAAALLDAKVFWENGRIVTDLDQVADQVNLDGAAMLDRLHLSIAYAVEREQPRETATYDQVSDGLAKRGVVDTEITRPPTTEYDWDVLLADGRHVALAGEQGGWTFATYTDDPREDEEDEEDADGVEGTGDEALARVLDQIAFRHATPDAVAKLLADARGEQLEATKAARMMANRMILEGASEVAVANALRVTRMTVRSWLGK